MRKEAPSGEQAAIPVRRKPFKQSAWLPSCVYSEVACTVFVFGCYLREAFYFAVYIGTEMGIKMATVHAAAYLGVYHG